jgi:hypothetical protein
MGFSLLGPNAILRAQWEPIKIEVQGHAEQRAKELQKLASKLEKDQDALDKFGQAKNMLGGDWKAIIIFVLSRYKAAEKVSTCQTIPKIRAKLEDLEKEKETPWAVFMAEDLLKARAELQAVDETMDNSEAVNTKDDPENLDGDGDPSLYGATMAS